MVKTGYGPPSEFLRNLSKVVIKDDPTPAILANALECSQGVIVYFIVSRTLLFQGTVAKQRKWELDPISLHCSQCRSNLIVHAGVEVMFVGCQEALPLFGAYR